jgi:alkanesulfonate monooxygenase SsuD/methylene tetrahydromethanopterin reductase-like flavin-dependent oxidoreductase (luciferase family)
VIVVPLHQPLALAKRVASLDVVSGGRVLFGVGVGYLEPEFAALGVPLARRGARLMEALAEMEAIWTGESVHGVRAEPRPVQRPGPPRHFGGYVTASYERAVRHGHGWYGFALDVARIEGCIAGLRAAAERVERPADLPPLAVSVTPHPRTPLDAEAVSRLAQLGVDRLVLLPPPEARTDVGNLQRFVEDEPARLRTS